MSKHSLPLHKRRNDASSARDRYWFKPGDRLQRVNWTREQRGQPTLHCPSQIGKQLQPRDDRGRFA